MIRSGSAGLEVEAYDTAVTKRQCLAYAAALGETADIYFDDARPGGIIAPPPLVVALEWPASRDVRETPAFGADAAERRMAVHAQQDTLFHRPIRPGDRLRCSGQIISVSRIKPGAKTVIRLELSDSNGAPVATTYTTGIYRGVGIDGDDRVLDTAPDWPALEAAGEWTETPVPIARELPHIYSECADIWNPIHTEREVALAAGLPDIILHGTCTWALAAQAVIANHAGGDPTRLARFSGRFTGMVIPGTDITVRHAPAEGGAVYEVIAADGSTAISEGRASFRD